MTTPTRTGPPLIGALLRMPLNLVRAHMLRALHAEGYTDLTEALELGSMIDCSEALVEGALARQESRGAHFRTDFPERDDKNWLNHTVVRKTSGGLELTKKSVSITVFEPKERKY